MKDWLRLMRIKHYIKNMLIFVPMFFGGAAFEFEKLRLGLLGFVCFSLIASVVYIFNDIQDVDKDRGHPIKKRRPIASGQISEKDAIIVAAILLVIGFGGVFFYGCWQSGILLVAYFILNVAYSIKLKKYQIVDVVILASGFIIRVFYGGFITGITVSKWLYLVIVAGSLYMGLGKRRNELRKYKSGHRDVLRLYSESFLDKNMYVCVALAIVFYSLWTLEMNNPFIIYTVPFFIIILMCYSYDTEGNSEGDPIEVIIGDKMLVILLLSYVACLFALLYLFGGNF